MANWTLDAARTGFHRRPVSGVELITTDEAAAGILKDVFEVWRLRQAGEIRRRDFHWLDDLGVRDPGWRAPWKGFLAVHRGPSGQPDGYARYRSEEKWVRPAAGQHAPSSTSSTRSTTTRPSRCGGSWPRWTS